MSPVLGSLLLASRDPERMRRWYRDVLGLDADVDGFVDAGVGILLDTREDVADRSLEPGRVVLNFHVSDIHSAQARADRAGATWKVGVEFRADAGLWFATLLDPDGNLVQLIQETPGYWDGTAERQGRSAGPFEGAKCSPRLPAQDLERARRFYAEVFGLVPTEERDGGLRYVTAAGDFVIFASSGRSSGDHTQLAFEVPDVDTTVARLRARGVDVAEPEDIPGHYPSSGAHGERGTWVLDSEGNLLGVSSLLRGHRLPHD